MQELMDHLEWLQFIPHFVTDLCAPVLRSSHAGPHCLCTRGVEFSKYTTSSTSFGCTRFREKSRIYCVQLINELMRGLFADRTEDATSGPAEVYEIGIVREVE